MTRATENTLAAGDDVRGGFRREGDFITGWCWSPDRPKERLRVDVFLDDKVNQSVVAARFQADLVRNGVCDGYHGFILALPAPLPAFTVMEARERSTGTVLGRVLSQSHVDVDGWTAAADGVAQDLATLRRQLGSRTAPLARGITEPLGRLLSSRYGARWRRPTDGLGLRVPAQPPLRRIVLHAGGGQQNEALSTVALIAPLLGSLQAVLTVVDDGMGAGSAVLAGIAGLDYQLAVCPGDAPPVGTAEEVGVPLVLLRAGQVSRHGLVSALVHIRDRGTVYVGPEIEVAAVQAGLGRPFRVAAYTDARSGLRLAVDVPLLSALQGFDKTVDDGMSLSLLDFALRAQQAGHVVAVISGPETQRPPPGPVASQARYAFAKRWGLVQ